MFVGAIGHCRQVFISRTNRLPDSLSDQLQPGEERMQANPPGAAAALLATAAVHLRSALRDMDNAQHWLQQNVALTDHSDELRELQEQLQALINKPSSDSAQR
jgi:hypothetical protein